MRRTSRRLFVAALLAALVAAVPAAAARADELPTKRLWGPDRFATAVAVSAATFGGQRPVALLARADVFADAMAASALAGDLEAPVLLSNRDSVPAATMSELRRLGNPQVLLLGGSGALGSGVEAQLRDAGVEVDRVGGASRTATAALLAARLGRERIGLIDGKRTALLTTSADFPDALAAGPLAYAARLPILLTPRDRLAAETGAAIRDLGIEQVIVLGGHLAVSGQVEAALGVPARRLQGSDRTRTAAAVAAFGVSKLGFSDAEVVVARGDAFPDALVAAPYAGRRRSPLLLTASATALGPGAREYLTGTRAAVRSLTALGGPSAISPAVLGAATVAVLGITYAFPISPSSAASYGRVHHDYPATDIFAACGTPVVAPTSGVVQEVSRVDTWDPRVDDGATRGGLSVSIVGDDGVRYYGSHFATIDSGVQPGARVSTGQVLGTVGRTGSARATPCHLHFGLSPACGPGDWEVRRGVVYPWPYLDAWKAGEHTSPAEAVSAWRAANPSRCARVT